MIKSQLRQVEGGLSTQSLDTPRGPTQVVTDFALWKVSYKYLRQNINTGGEL
jgi:hypothetical protein